MSGSSVTDWGRDRYGWRRYGYGCGRLDIRPVVNFLVHICTPRVFLRWDIGIYTGFTFVESACGTALRHILEIVYDRRIEEGDSLVDGFRGLFLLFLLALCLLRGHGEIEQEWMDR